MTEVLDGMAVLPPVNIEESCPICGKTAHDFPEKKPVDIDTIKSKPRSLGCGHLNPREQRGKYGRARHHMIPVHQCYTKVVRLAQMAESVGYNINGKQNGIPLPTVWNKYEADGQKKNFGELNDDQKNEIRNSAMRMTGGQWHVGHHHYDLPEKEDATEDMEDEGELDHVPYDMEVIKQLTRLAKKILNADLCEAEDQSKVKDRLDNLCKDIESKLNAFKANPKSSKPFYVSKWAMIFEA